MENLDDLSDADLRALLIEHGFGNRPITSTTRGLYLKKLRAKLEETENAPSPAEPKRGRRQSAPPKASSTKRRVSNIPSQATDTAESDNETPAELPSKPSSKPTRSRRASDISSVSSRNGNSATENESVPQSMRHMSDEELLVQLIENNISYNTIDDKTRPILMKKLNHALARKRQQEKLEASSSKVRSRHSIACGPDQSIVFNKTVVDSEDDFMEIDNSSSLQQQSSPAEKPKVSLSYSPQHSLTLGNDSTDNVSLQSAGWKSLFPSPRLPQLRKRKVVNRFVEEQEEPYDTGSDSDMDFKPAKPRQPSRIWKTFSSLWSTRPAESHSDQTLNSSSTNIITTLKEKVTSLCQWQMITLVLPVMAVLFFLGIGALYMSSVGQKHVDHYPVCGKVPDSEPCITDSLIVSQLREVVGPLKQKLSEEAAAHQCQDKGTGAVSTEELKRWKPLTDQVLEAFRNASLLNRHWNVENRDNQWTITSPRLPFFCSLKQILVTLFTAVLFSVGGSAVVYFGYKIAVHYSRKKQAAEQEVFALVEASIDLLARHHASVMADNRGQEAYLAVNHVRDLLIAPKDRKQKQSIWLQAVKFLEENESRVRAEVQQIRGEEYRVWRWLPPVSTSTPTDPVRARVWQGQAFSTGKDGVNAPPAYPLTQCLKVRNMFDAEVECGDNWPVRIQDAILEKAENTPVYHIAVDKASREGCVYIMCKTPEDAGKVYRALHGWWFDGNLVTVKYLRLERYLQRFPEAARCAGPLKPSNNDKLSLPARFWRSPLEHI